MTSRRAGFAGWRIVAISAVTLGMTAPGQTVGFSAFVDPMIAGLDVTRTQVSTAYLVGTLTGALAMPRVGTFIDRRGTRHAMLAIAAAFGLALAAMSGVVGFVTLMVGFVGIRMFGQGGLTLVATTAVAPWFERRRGFALGVTTASGSALMALFPLLSTFLILRLGWRPSWIVLAVLMWAVVLPLGRWGMVTRPEDLGQRADGAHASADDDRAVAGMAAFTRREAVHTAMFWAIAGAVAATGMIATALSFHQIDLLGEQGLTPVQAAANFLPQTLAALVATLGAGWLLDRAPAKLVLVSAMVVLAVAMLVVGHVSPGVTAIGYGMLLGTAGSSVRAMEVATLPALFGVRHLGAIRGVIIAISIAASAFGPLALSLGQHFTGSYTGVLRGLVALPVAVAGFALVAPQPRRTLGGSPA